MDASLRFLRTVQGALLVSMLLYGWVAVRFGPVPREVDPVFFNAVVGLALSCAVAAFVVRTKLIPRQAAILASNPEELAALRRWRAWQITSYALCEAVVLYGVVLRFVGAQFSRVVYFFLAGFTLLLLFRPQRPAA